MIIQIQPSFSHNSHPSSVTSIYLLDPVNAMEEVYSAVNPVQVMVITEDVSGDYPYVEWMGNHILYRDSIYSIALLNSEIKRHSMVISRSSEFDELILYIEDLEEKENREKTHGNEPTRMDVKSEELQDMVDENEGNGFANSNE